MKMLQRVLIFFLCILIVFFLQNSYAFDLPTETWNLLTTHGQWQFPKWGSGLFKPYLHKGIDLEGENGEGIKAGENGQVLLIVRDLGNKKNNYDPQN